jgi:2-C-methyl-D-erythritol 2,4-cyclodiphosphate synthase
MMRTGFGYDVHRLVAGRPLVLGGVVIPSDLGLDGHSDADVLLHAITDALLGAAALGDIGSHFPDTDDRYRGADSRVLLGEVVRLVAEAGFAISNVDATVALQQPKLRQHVQAMRESIAGILGVHVGQVSVKATTTERLGFVGDRSGASAYAVCTIGDGPGRPRDL